MRTIIAVQLSMIKKNQDVAFIYACESGSKIPFIVQHKHP